MKQDQQDSAKINPQLNNAQSPLSSAVGIDLGDRWSRYCVVNSAGEVVTEDRVRTTPEGMERLFQEMPATRVVIEAAAHSPWVSRQLESYGHQVIVANPRKVRMIYESDRKNDRIDARMLARLGRVDVSLLGPVHHRSASAQADRAVVRSRDTLVAARTRLVNAVRGIVKTTGHQLPRSTTAAFAHKILPMIPTELKPALLPLLRSIKALSEQIHRYDERVEQLAETKYPQTRLLQQVKGIGPLIALTYVLTLEDPKRFTHSRTVGSYLGLSPRQYESGRCAPELGISKAGNNHLRWLLVQSAQYILGPFAPDSSLRRWGLALAGRGGKKSKRRAVVAVARNSQFCCITCGQQEMCMIHYTVDELRQHDPGEGKDVALGSPSRKPDIWFPIRHPSLWRIDSRTVLGVKGSLRRGQHRRALDSCAPFRREWTRDGRLRPGTRYRRGRLTKRNYF